MFLGDSGVSSLLSLSPFPFTTTSPPLMQAVQHYVHITTHHAAYSTHAALRSTTQHHAASRSITQHHAASRSITQHHVASHSIIQHHKLYLQYKDLLKLFVVCYACFIHVKPNIFNSSTHRYILIFLFYSLLLSLSLPSSHSPLFLLPSYLSKYIVVTNINRQPNTHMKFE